MKEAIQFNEAQAIHVAAEYRQGVQICLQDEDAEICFILGRDDALRLSAMLTAGVEHLASC